MLFAQNALGFYVVGNTDAKCTFIPVKNEEKVLIMLEQRGFIFKKIPLGVMAVNEETDELIVLTKTREACLEASQIILK